MNTHAIHNVRTEKKSTVSLVVWEIPYINVNYLNKWCSKYSDQMYFCVKLICICGIIGDDFKYGSLVQFLSQDLTIVMCIMSISQQFALNITQSTNLRNFIFVKCTV